SLSQAGIASLRYDKRGTGESEGVSSDSSMNDLLADVRIGLSALQACDKIDRQSCFLIGHSEGGILAAIIASERDDLAGIVIIGGAARSLDVIIREQVERLNRGSGMSEEQLQIALEQEDQYLSFVRLSTGEWSSYSFGQLKEAMPWLTEEKYDEVTALSLLWLREHFQHDPLATIRQVSCPVLIIQGEKDLQISAREGKLLAAGLAGGGNSDVTLNIFPDLNHLLRYHPEEPNLLNRHLDLPIDLRVTTAISTWLLDHNVPR
ncbi:alpha/beta hydrolase, partial [Candidatus Bipolaricaulota bacterium]|nr:alpha/beta hydrolase [Candidatus Bipolaricaulota bacterium]